jgi:hypothetical protein
VSWQHGDQEYMAPATIDAGDECLLELYRAGSFRVDGVTDDSNRCGIESGPLVFRYEVRLHCSGAGLDGRGFIIDNRLVNTYWIDKYQNDRPKVLPSCEQMSREAMADFRALCDKAGTPLLGAEIRIYGGTHSAVTDRWGKIVPSQANPISGAPAPQPVREPVPADDPTYQALKEVLNVR